MSEELKMPPSMALGMLISAVKCGERFTDLHEQAANVLRAALAPAESGEGAKCQTCDDVGVVGRPTYSNPDDCISDCPDCKPEPPAAMAGSMAEPVRPIGMATSSSVLGVEWFGGQPDNGTIVYPESAIQHLQSQIAELKRELGGVKANYDLLHNTYMNESIGDEYCCCGECPPRPDHRAPLIATLTQQLAMLPADWSKDSSLETWSPLTAEHLSRVEQQLAEARERKQDQHIFVGYTNGHQILYGNEPDGQGAFYPTPDNECLIPIYMLKIHAHRLQTTSNMDVTLEQIQKLQEAARLESGTQGEE